MRTKYKPSAVKYLEENRENRIDEDNLQSYLDSDFFNDNVYFEIGPGKGQFIVNIAKLFPDRNFVVFEMNPTIAGICLKKIDEANLKNIRLIYGDFLCFSEFFKDSSIDGIYLNFSDPWPKKRHEKRRLTSDRFLCVYSRILKLNSSIYFKSDNDDFSSYSHDKFLERKFAIIYYNEDYKVDLTDDFTTEFETRFAAKGVKIKRIIARKVDNTLKEFI
jgi:tRNA (guanine-N7-)-methyltransferase